MKRVFAFLLAFGIMQAYLPMPGARAQGESDRQLVTRWAKQVTPDNAWPEYPRPMMVREQWRNLNGHWDYAIRPRAENAPVQFEGKILVPFAAESSLSGVQKAVGENNTLWYRKRFELPEAWRDQKILLHFGAVDWEARVWVNGTEVGMHRGGYDSFSFEITAALKSSGEQQITLAVWDPGDVGSQPRGKQVRNPRGIWYTSVTGIWQTVWLEPVPQLSIKSLRITPDIDNQLVKVTVQGLGANGAELVQVMVLDGGREVASENGFLGLPVQLKIDRPKLWSPDKPFLYDLQVTLQHLGENVDEVHSYFGMRKIEMVKASDGLNRLFLNNNELFQLGPLDQGWWPDGLYTAPTDEALRYDVEMMKKVGFNMVRKHVKVEHARWYYHCDRLGLMVWQDMPSSGFGRGNRQREPSSAAQFERELRAMLDSHINHPSIVMWIPFNEGWGQYDTPRLTNWIKGYDPSRLVCPASGWTDHPFGDVKDIHSYPGPAMAKPEIQRAIVLGEFGGLGLPLEGHLWEDRRNWGYRNYRDRDELREHYDELYAQLHLLVGEGLAAAVYTQLSDVESEVNGLMTYDRELLKIDAEHLAEVHNRLYQPPPSVKTIVPSSKLKPQAWRFTIEQPAANWNSPTFADAGWKKGNGGFGKPDTPGAVVGTPWETSDIWLRRTFQLEQIPRQNVYLHIHHDEDAEVFLNGRLVKRLPGYSTGYKYAPLAAEALALLKEGEDNFLAVHCHQTDGGQFIDVGIVELIYN